MLPQYNTDELIDNIKRRCSVPTSQLTYTNADFVKLANDQLQTKVVPLIMSAREEYFVEDVTVLSPADGVIEIPAEAAGAKLRSVCYKQQDNPLILNNLPRIDLDLIAGSGFWNYDALAGFFVKGDNIVLYPNTAVPTNTPISLFYYRRTLVLTDDANYGQVTSVDPITNTVILTFVPYTWTTGTQLNSVSSVPNFKITNALATVVGASSPSVILDDVTGIAVGDYISPLGFSAVPQVLVEAHAYLAQLTAVKCLEGLGDRDGMAAAQAEAKDMKPDLLTMISQRVDGSVKKVMPASGGLRTGAGLGFQRRGWGW